MMQRDALRLTWLIAAIVVLGLLITQALVKKKRRRRALRMVLLYTGPAVLLFYINVIQLRHWRAIPLYLLLLAGVPPLLFYVAYYFDLLRSRQDAPPAAVATKAEAEAEAKAKAKAPTSAAPLAQKSGPPSEPRLTPAPKPKPAPAPTPKPAPEPAPPRALAPQPAHELKSAPEPELLLKPASKLLLLAPAPEERPGPPESSFDAYCAQAEELKEQGCSLVAADLYRRARMSADCVQEEKRALFAEIKCYLEGSDFSAARRLMETLRTSYDLSPLESLKFGALAKFAKGAQ